MMCRFIERLRRFFWPKGYFFVVPKDATLVVHGQVSVDNISVEGGQVVISSGWGSEHSPSPTTHGTSQPPPLPPSWPKTLGLDPGFEEALSRALLKPRAKPKKGFPANPKAGGPTCDTCGWWKRSTPSNPGGECYNTGYGAAAKRPSCGIWMPIERKPAKQKRKKSRGKKRRKGKNRARA